MSKALSTNKTQASREEYNAIPKDTVIEGRKPILDILDILRRDSNDNVEPNKDADEEFLNKITEPALFHISPQTWVLITPGKTEAGGTKNPPTLYICTPNAKDETSGKEHYESNGITPETFYTKSPKDSRVYFGE